jgi:catechol 2,3-dioxygenase-like lactoylglutathione lyase family enzyme
MITGIGTHIKVSNFKQSQTFYEALGFTKVFEYGPGTSVPEAYHGITFMQGGCKLEIADGHRAVKPNVFKERVSSSKISLMINVDNLEEIIGRARKAHIPLAVNPRHYYWGTLEAVIKDPDGVVLVFIAPYNENEAKKLNADETFGTPPNS